jgi:release factor glutamine methyltransferase
MVERRLNGEPLQYVLGFWGFRRLELAVDRRVLIPRPETEQVVEAALEVLDRTGRSGATVVDLGTGSGAIAISIAGERPGTRVWATDLSNHALQVARSNDPAGRVRFVAGDWWDALPAALKGHVDLVVSNPPYVAAFEVADLDPKVRDWEPEMALVAGERGTEAIEAVVGGARSWLGPGGGLVVELAPHQAAGMAAFAARLGYVGVAVLRDLAGRDRILVGRSPGSPPESTVGGTARRPCAGGRAPWL